MNYDIISCKGIWNQLVLNGNISDLSYWSTQGASISASDNVLTINGTGQTYSGAIARTTDLIVGHKYMISFEAKSTSEAYFGTGGGGVYYAANFQTTTEWKRYSLFLTAVESNHFVIIYRYVSLDPLYVRKVQLFDLTKLFSSGNKPSTYDNAKAAILDRYNIDIDNYQEYNSGQAILQRNVIQIDANRQGRIIY